MVRVGGSELRETQKITGLKCLTTKKNINYERCEAKIIYNEQIKTITRGGETIQVARPRNCLEAMAGKKKANEVFTKEQSNAA